MGTLYSDGLGCASLFTRGVGGSGPGTDTPQTPPGDGAMS